MIVSEAEDERQPFSEVQMTFHEAANLEVLQTDSLAYSVMK